MKTPIKNNLRELRKKANLTQTELARTLSFNDSQDRMSKWEKGKGIPNIPNLLKLCEFFGVSPREIYPEL